LSTVLFAYCSVVLPYLVSSLGPLPSPYYCLHSPYCGGVVQFMGNACSAGNQQPPVVETIAEIHTPASSLHHGHPSSSSVNIEELADEEQQEGGPRMYKDLLSTTEFRVFTVREVKQITHNTKQLRFWLPNGTMLDIPLGSHIQIRAMIDGQYVTRNYTPTSTATDKGYFDIIVKAYDNGSVSKHLCSLTVGEAVDVRGPFGVFKYTPNMHRSLCMICGGTGITPMLQVARTILSDPRETTRIYLLSSNHTEKDILCKEELATLRTTYKTRLEVYHVVTTPSAPGWDTALAGRIDLWKIERFLPGPEEGVFVLVCGSYLFWKAMQGLLLEAHFEEEQLFSF